MSLAGEGVVSIWHDVAPEGLDDWYAWHTHEHMPERVGIPGFLRGRRYLAIDGEPACFTFYEALTIETLGGQDYQGRLNMPTPWTMRAGAHTRNHSRATQRVRHSIGPGMGGVALTVRLETDADPDVFADRVNRGILVPLGLVRGIAGAHLCQTDVSISTRPAKEKQGREAQIKVPGWMLMVEGAAPGVLDRVRRDIVTGAALEAAGARDAGLAGVYQLEYVRTKTAASA